MNELLVSRASHHLFVCRSIELRKLILLEMSISYIY